MDEKNPFFKLEDFQTLEMLIDGLNQTSQVRFPRGTEAVLLVQIMADGIWIEVPAKSCAMGHTLSLDINAKKMSGKKKVTLASGEIREEDQYLENKMSIIGVIAEMQCEPNARQQVRLRFRQYAQNQWDSLLEYFAEKQHGINQIIKSTRK